MELMWAFYGYSKPFCILIGGLEIIGGLLLLYTATRLLGAILLSCVLINVILQDIFYHVNQGALIAAIFYQALTFIILLFSKRQILATIQFYLMQIAGSHLSLKKYIFIICSGTALAVCIKILEVLVMH